MRDNFLNEAKHMFLPHHRDNQACMVVDIGERITGIIIIGSVPEVVMNHGDKFTLTTSGTEKKCSFYLREKLITT